MILDDLNYMYFYIKFCLGLNGGTTTSPLGSPPSNPVLSSPVPCLQSSISDHLLITTLRRVKNNWVVTRVGKKPAFIENVLASG